MPAKKPVILCFHGYGTNATIFRVQLRHLRLALGTDFHFVFVDGPFTAPAGPGVLPHFAGCGPYNSWSSSIKDVALGNSTSDLKMVLNAIDKCLIKQGLAARDVVAMLGFSQGALIASLMSLLRRAQSSLWPNLKLTILICGAYHDVLETFLRGQRLELPSIHIHGLRDPYLKSSRRLYSHVFEGNTAIKVEIDIDHTLPHGEKDVAQIASHVQKACALSHGLYGP